MANPPKPTALQESSSVVEIATIPRKFQSTGIGALHQLFLPLLALARNAYNVQVQESSEKAYRAASFMAGELIRDFNFTPGRPFTKIPNFYLLDFQTNRYQVETDVFAQSEGCSAFFHVKIAGEIQGENFVVWDPSIDKDIFKFTLSEARKPEYFEREFPFIAYHARVNSAEFSHDASDSMVEQIIDMQLVVSVLDKTVKIRVHKKVGDLYMNVQDINTGQDIMRLPVMRLNNLPGMMKSIEQHLIAHPLETSEAPPKTA
jgi:hypothetical protein